MTAPHSTGAASPIIPVAGAGRHPTDGQAVRRVDLPNLPLGVRPIPPAQLASIFGEPRDADLPPWWLIGAALAALIGSVLFVFWLGSF